MLCVFILFASVVSFTFRCSLSPAQEFVVDALPVELIGMNSKLMCEYIQFCADRLLHALGCNAFYNTQNPFEWMDTISLQGKTNFFEKRVSEYAKAGVGVRKEEQSFDLDVDF